MRDHYGHTMCVALSDLHLNKKINFLLLIRMFISFSRTEYCVLSNESLNDYYYFLNYSNRNKVHLN